MCSLSEHRSRFLSEHLGCGGSGVSRLRGSTGPAHPDPSVRRRVHVGRTRRTLSDGTQHLSRSRITGLAPARLNDEAGCHPSGAGRRQRELQLCVSLFEIIG